jgi:hypothetical protein
VCVAAVLAVRQVQGRGLLLKGVPTMTPLRHIWFRSVTEIDKIGREREREAEREREMQRKGGRREIQVPKEIFKANLGRKNSAKRDREVMFGYALNFIFYNYTIIKWYIIYIYRKKKVQRKYGGFGRHGLLTLLTSTYSDLHQPTTHIHIYIYIYIYIYKYISPNNYYIAIYICIYIYIY